MPSRAESFFQQIKESSDVVAHLRKLVRDNSEETEFLEFKGGRIEEKETKKYWSQALSGFANTEGGVLVFGIKTDRIEPPGGGRKIDTAVDEDLVANPTQFIQLLKDVRLAATIDPVQGVDYLPIPAESSGAGFVVCLVPEGANKPYRAELDPSSNYFQCVGDNFVKISHSLLRSLFFPRTSPRLKLRVTVELEDVHLFRVLCHLENDGTATAREKILQVVSNRPLTSIVLLNSLNSLVPQSNKPVSRVKLHDPAPLHPGDAGSIFRVGWSKTDDDGKWLPHPKLTIDVFMADQKPVRFDVQVPLDHPTNVPLIFDSR